jgi:hypothetical protein
MGSAIDPSSIVAVNTNVLGDGLYGYLADALQVVQNTGQLVKLTNILSPLDRPATAKISNTRIANVYNTLAKGSIPLTAQSANPTGQSVFAELSVVASETSGGVTAFVPMVGRVELRIPNHGSITDLVVAELMWSTLALLLKPDDGGLRVREIMRGVLFPD